MTAADLLQPLWTGLAWLPWALGAIAAVTCLGLFVRERIGAHWRERE
jgi:hypothetical protein